MKFTYSEFEGDGPGRFLSPDDLFPSDNFMDFLLTYGQQGLDALDDPPEEDEQLAQIISELIDAGLLERDEESGRLRPTDRMTRGMQHKAFLEIFRNLKPGVRAGHPTSDPGQSGERTEGTKPYTWGDPLSEIDLGQTMRNAIQREARRHEGTEARSVVETDAAGVLPIKFQDADFELFNIESSTESALCILLDLSGSMMRYGRHVAAKRVAMGLRSLIREKFPLDTVDFVGFASTAQTIPEKDLALVMPKPITTREWEVRVRVPLDQAEMTHPHFTNLHHALRVGRQRLARQGAMNKQMFIITDGEPTAHLSGENKEILNLVYPPCEASAEATLTEALACYQQGIRISSFALIEEYYAMDWVGFVDQLTRLVKGVAFYCTAGDLGATIMESYLAGKREKKALGG